MHRQNLSILVYTGYNAHRVNGQISMRSSDTACNGGDGSSYVFSAQTLSEPGCQGVPSNPLNLSMTCGEPQAYKTIQMAFEQRSSFTLGFSVLCANNECGSELYTENSNYNTQIRWIINYKCGLFQRWKEGNISEF